MKGEPAVYRGRIVDKQHFRAFVYSAHGDQKLVESWDAFEAAMQSGVWFATQEDAAAVKDAKVKRKARVKLDEPVDEIVIEGGLITNKDV